MNRFFGWLRGNAERHLLIAAQKDMASRYLQREGPVIRQRFFWRRVFVPLYRLLPWRLRHRIMSAMPGSHRQWYRGSGPPRRS
ncbi:MAG TPA: hypothetical protein VFZ63_15535 [Jiangellaceae bacterium]